MLSVPWFGVKVTQGLWEWILQIFVLVDSVRKQVYHLQLTAVTSFQTRVHRFSNKQTQKLWDCILGLCSLWLQGVFQNHFTRQKRLLNCRASLMWLFLLLKRVQRPKRRRAKETITVTILNLSSLSCMFWAFAIRIRQWSNFFKFCFSNCVSQQWAMTCIVS